MNVVKRMLGREARAGEQEQGEAVLVLLAERSYIGSADEARAEEQEQREAVLVLLPERVCPPPLCSYLIAMGCPLGYAATHCVRYWLRVCCYAVLSGTERLGIRYAVTSER
eukprot:3740862-Rhodomonas_salina.1